MLRHQQRVLWSVVARAGGVHADEVSYLQPAWVRLWNPDWQRSHLSPVTPGLHVHTPLLSHCRDSEPEHTHDHLYVYLCEPLMNVLMGRLGRDAPTALQPQGRQPLPSTSRW